jgi:hypothetical protein
MLPYLKAPIFLDDLFHDLKKFLAKEVVHFFIRPSRPFVL